MTVQATLRGAGRVASGSTVAWYRTAEWLLAHGPATLDQIMEACGEYVDAGYARRWQAQRLRRNRKYDSSVRGVRASRTEEVKPGDIDVDHARRQWMSQKLGDSKRDGSIIRHGAMYQATRLPKPPAGLTHEQVTGDPVAARRTVASHNLLVAMKRARTRLESPQGKLSKEERAVIVAWLDAHDPHADCAESP